MKGFARVPLRVVSLSIGLMAAFLTLNSPLWAQGSQTTPLRPMEIEDQYRIKRVGSPVLSPDGGWVAYTVSTTNLEKDESKTQIWMVSTRGGDPIPLTMSGESASSPKWSPDGKHLSFTASRGEGAKSQVWLLDRRGGEAQPLTDVEQGVGGYEWSPDGSKLLLTIRDADTTDASAEGGENTQVRDPWVIDRLQTKRDGQGFLTDTRKTHLYVFDVKTKKLTQITSGPWDEGSPAWSPDGSKVAFSSNRTKDPDANSNSDIWVVSANNTDKGGTLVRITDFEGGDGGPTWSPDGEWIAYTTGINDPRFGAFETTHMAVRASDGTGERRIMTEALDRNVGSLKFTSDGLGVLLSVSEEGRGHVARVDVGTGAVTRVIDGEVQASGFSVGPDGLFASVISDPQSFGEVFIQRGAVRTKLSNVNDSIREVLHLAEVRNIHFDSPDGTEIEGWVFFPPDYEEGRQYPTLLRIHGGPNGSYGVGFNTEAQILAAHGYLVLITNPRGSSGYGREFGFALWQKWGIPDFEDVMAGVDFVIQEGWADPDRLGVGGWSYGGILTNYVITKTDRFKGAISGASMGLLVANFGHDHYQLGNEREWGNPWENRQLWEDLSPWNDIGNVTTPSLFMGGESDWNVPILNSEQMYLGLKRRGIDTRLVVYPGQPHGLRIPSYNVHRYKEYLAWYDKYVKGEEDTPPMRMNRVLAALAVPTIGAAVLWSLATAKPAAVRWGSDGHRMAARAAHGILPAEMPAFFREAGGQLEYLSPEPDRWRNGDLTEMDEAWKYDHYIDLENVPSGAMGASDRFEFITELFEAGIDRPQQNVGFLPFRILEMHQRLATGFAHWRLARAGSDRDWIEARILNDAGIIGHYVVDAAQPHHTTIHFNGWAEGVPNPKGFTSDRDFHSRFESGFVRTHLAFEDLPPLMPRGPRELDDVRKTVWDHVASTNATVERLYELEKEHGFEADEPHHPETREFALERLATGAELLSAIWWTAWKGSEAIADGIRDQRGGR